MLLGFSPDGLRVAAAVGPYVRLWDAASCREIARMEHAAGIRAIAFSPDGSRLATCGDDGTARLWAA
jgi:WD40 repeat protein